MNPLLIIIGLGIAVLGYFTLKKNRHLTKVGIKTMSKVVDIAEQHGTDSDGYSTTSYYPVLEFSDNQQQTHRFQGNVGGGKRKYKIGQEVEILYDPQDPKKAQMKSFGAQWIMPLVLMAVGAMLIFGGFVGKF